MNRSFDQYKTLILLTIVILATFIGRTLLAVNFHPLRLFDIFDTLTVLGSLVVLASGFRSLRKSDWITALVLGIVVATGMVFASLFTPYPIMGIISSNTGQALVRGIFTAVAALGGLVVMRKGGPVLFFIPDGDWRKSGRNLLFGLSVGAPLAIVNIFALQISEGRPISLQNPFAALLDALQPGIVEEVIYRFALVGLLWLLLRKTLPDTAAWASGVLVMLVHSYAHFSDLFLQAPLVALGMGLVLALIWGLPLTYLALRRGLEASIAFHWIQDVARFLAGF